MAKLPGDYVAGLVDGEGHFGLGHRLEIKRSRGGQEYYWAGWRWAVTFTINLHADDAEILKQVGRTLGCGKVYHDKTRPLAMYRVDDFESLIGKVIPFFEVYPLRAKKRLDFELWKEAIGILWSVKRRSGGRGQKMKIFPEERKKLRTIHLKLKDLHGRSEPNSKATQLKKIHRKYHRGNR